MSYFGTRLKRKYTASIHRTVFPTIFKSKWLFEVEYYHIECETHSAIFANGILAESYLDTNNRGVFKDNKKCLPVNTFTMVYT
jgi:hypothetical protein